MNNLAKGTLLGAGAAALALSVAGACSALESRSLIKIAFDGRAVPTPSLKVKRLFSGCRQMDDIEKFCVENAWKLEHCSCERITIKSRDGNMLTGHFFRAKNPKRTLIAMHGWRTTWARDFGAVSDFWHSHDCNVLYAEQRGHSDLDRDVYMSFGINERYDCLEWIKWINREDGLRELPIYLCGVSMGAATVLMTTGFALPENVKGVIADCGFTSPHNVFKHVINKNLHCPYSDITARHTDIICKRRKMVSPRSYSTLEAMKVCKVPVLFVHGTEDRFVPISMTYENYKICSAPKRMFIVPGAEHGMCYFTDKNGYEREMLSFFNEYDAYSATRQP